MSLKSVDERTLSLENIGGIDRTSVTFAPSVIVPAGRNATNRSSLLQGIQVVHALDDTSLKGGTEEGGVTLIFADESY